ncbi:MAG: hypothetical protein SCM11_02885 [Bacillota bacterium]|nr:hypothetical protein [Bacillota bacterium]
MDAIKAGFIGFAERNIPNEVAKRLCKTAVSQLLSLGWDVCETGPVSDDDTYEEADTAITRLKKQEFNLLVVCIAGWIPTHAVIHVTDQFRYVPMLLWGLTGWMEDGRFITTAPQAGTTALRQVMQGLGYRFRYVYNRIDQPIPLEQINHFGQAALAADLLRTARIGSMGYRDMLLYGTMFDGLSLRRDIGVEVEFFEMLEIIRNLDQTDEAEVQKITAYCMKNWIFDKPIDQSVLIKGIKYFLALREIIQRRKFDAVTLIDVDGMKKLEGFPPAMVFMLIADQLDVCTIPENDIIGNVTQLMIKFLTGQQAHYMEFYEFFEDRVLIGVPDYIPSSAVYGDVHLLPARFGQFQGSLLNVSRVRDGRVTLLRLIEDRGSYSMHLVVGTAVQPRSWEEYGWTQPAPQLPSLEVILDQPVSQFADKVASQHTIVAYGDWTDSIEQLCLILGIQII